MSLGFFSANKQKNRGQKITPQWSSLLHRLCVAFKSHLTLNLCLTTAKRVSNLIPLVNLNIWYVHEEHCVLYFKSWCDVLLFNIRDFLGFSQITGGQPLTVEVAGVEYMNDDPAMTDVLYAKVHMKDGSDR